MGNLVIDLTAVNDTLVEGDESYTVALATPTSTTGSAIALGAESTVTTTITDNDTATWSITGETSVTESAVNNTASYTVSLGGTLQAGEDASIVSEPDERDHQRGRQRPGHGSAIRCGGGGGGGGATTAAPTRAR